MTQPALPVAGRHRRLTIPANRDRDTPSKAACVSGHDNAGDCGWSNDGRGYCPRHFPAWYALVSGGAKHRKTVQAR